MTQQNGGKAYSVFIAKPRDDEFGGPGKDVFLKLAPVYYDLYPSDGGCPIRRSKVLANNELLTALQAIAQEASTHVMIANHAGEETGLWFDVGPKGYERGWERMGMLLLLLELRLAERACRRSNAPADWKALATRIPEKPPTWANPGRMLATVKNTARSSGVSGLPADASTARIREKVTEMVNGWRYHLMREIGAGTQDVIALVDALEAVHKIGIERLEVRGCEMGVNFELMQLTGRFFGAKLIRAPKVFLNMGVVEAVVHPEFEGFRKRKTARAPVERRTQYVPSALARHGSGTLYEFGLLPGDRDQVFIAALEKTGKLALIAESVDALEVFVRRKLGLPRGWEVLKARRVVVLQCVLEPQLAFPGDPEYKAAYVEVRVRDVIK